MIILAIDPGTNESAFVLYDTGTQRILSHGIVPNEQMCDYLPATSVHADYLVIEMIACYGMPVGRETFETCVWIGRFIQTWAILVKHTLIYRRDVKLHLCNSARAKDANVRQALIDKFPATGGGKTPQIGTKKKPGPLYGIKSHLWAALAVAVTWAEQHKEAASG